MVRVGAVNYLNTKPLIEGLCEFAPSIDLQLDLPSRLADRLAQGDLDVGLIPVVELFRAGNYTFIPDCGISSCGPGGVGSSNITFRSLPIDVPADDVSTDAVLLIGDRAMKACLPGFEFSYDLGQNWTDLTGLPMVWAVWAVRPGVDLGEAEHAFVKAKRHGRSRAGAIAAREAAKLGLDPGYCRRYFDTIIRYDLGDTELAGLKRYYQLTAELNLAPEGVQLVRYHRPHLVPSR